MASENFIRILGQVLEFVVRFLWNCLYLVIIGLIIYAVYLVVFHTYPRLTLLGHTESGFDDFMSAYFADLVVYGGGGDLRKAWGDFAEAYQELAKGDAYGGVLAAEERDFSINGSLHLHVLFMFYGDFKANSKSRFGQCYGILRKKVSGASADLLAGFYGGGGGEGGGEGGEGGDGGNFVEVDDAVWDSFLKLYGAFGSLRKHVRERAGEIYKQGVAAERTKANIDLLMLDVMLTKYFDGTGLSGAGSTDNIQRMYQLRQTGGFSNFRLVAIYIGDYWDYAINQKIKKDIWGRFPRQMETLADRVLTAITSDSVTNWFLTLPARLAGTDSEAFVQKYPRAAAAFKEAFTPSPYRRDVRENFVQQLLQIAKTFVAMFEVITAIVNVISDPVAFIKFLIGYIIAIVLYIIYFILVNIQIAVAIAYIWAVAAAVGGTIYWASQVLVFAAFYAVLSVIDMPLGGFIMRSLRCENLPDAWSRVANWHNSNMYQRSLFCSYQCRRGFYPGDFLGWCTKQAPDEPTMAPQQIIYNSFKNAQYILSLTKPLYSHNADVEYYRLSMRPDKQKEIWKRVYDARKDYIQVCKTGSGSNTAYSEYDGLIKQMCGYLVTDPGTDPKVVGLCHTLYCGDDDAPNNPMCMTTVSQDALISSEAETKDLVRIILMTVITIIVVFLALYFVLKHEGGSLQGSILGSAMNRFKRG